MKKISILFVLSILTIAFCACATTSALKNNATTEKYNYAILFNLTPVELNSLLADPSFVTSFTDEQKKVELFVYDVEGNLPAGISFNPKNGKIFLDFETFLFLMEYGFEDGQLITYVQDIKSIGKEPYSINEKKDVCSHKTALFASKSGALALYECKVRDMGLFSKAKWTKSDLFKK